MSVPSLLRRVGVGITILACTMVPAGCGGSGDENDAPDEANFCRLALLSEPVAEASAPVLQRLDELAPDEVNAAIVVLREASDELAELSPRSPEAIALEFEIRFRPGYIAARNEAEAFIDSECRPPPTTTLDKGDKEGETDLPSVDPEPPPDGSVPSDSVGPTGDG